MSHTPDAPWVYLASGEPGAHILAVAPSAVGGADHVVRIFDLESHTMPAMLRDHENRLQAVAFSPDGRWLTSTSWHETTCLWDLSVLATPPRDVLASSSSRYGLVLDGATVVAGP